MKLFDDEEIRDAAVHTSPGLSLITAYNRMTAIFSNTLDEAVDLIFYGAHEADFSDEIAIDVAVTVAALTGKDYEWWWIPFGYIRVTAEAAGIPTLGALNVELKGTS